MELQKLCFLIKAIYDVWPTPVNLHAWGLPTSNQCRECGKTANLKHILTGCEYALRSYIWKHNKVLEVFAKAAKTCRDTANKALNNITNRVIHFIKGGNSLKLSSKNKHRSSLLHGLAHCNWFRTSFRISNRNSINNPAFRYCDLVR